MAKVKKEVKYNGRTNPYKLRSKDWYEYENQRTWFFENLNLLIVSDFLKQLDTTLMYDSEYQQSLNELMNNND